MSQFHVLAYLSTYFPRIDNIDMSPAKQPVRKGEKKKTHLYEEDTLVHHSRRKNLEDHVCQWFAREHIATNKFRQNIDLIRINVRYSLDHGTWDEIDCWDG